MTKTNNSTSSSAECDVFDLNKVYHQPPQRAAKAQLVGSRMDRAPQRAPPPSRPEGAGSCQQSIDQQKIVGVEPSVHATHAAARAPRTQRPRTP